MNLPLSLLTTLALATAGLLGAPSAPSEPAAPAGLGRPDIRTAAGITGGAASAPAAEPVVEELELVVASVDAAAERGGAAPRDVATTADLVVADRLVAPGRVETDVVEADGFQTVGVTWPEGADVDQLGVQVRSRTDGSWSPWTELDTNDEGPDAGTADAAHAVRGGTDAVAIGDAADAVQLAFSATSDGGPDDLRLTLIGSEQLPTPAIAGGPADAVVPGAASAGRVLGGSGAFVAATAAAGGVGTVAGTTPTTVAAAVTSQPPRVISRAEWGAPAPACRADVADSLVGAAVHHTAGSTGYATVAQAMQQIRNDAAYHMSTRGWCDIGYNFIVDKWGNIYEGRAGSLTEAVIGVHAGGFNTGTLGVSMLGTFDVAPSAATQRAVADIIGWRLSAYGVDPRSTVEYSTGTGENSRFQNQKVRLPRIFGHRDVAYTACPGDGGYAALGAIRTMAWQASQAGWPTPTTNLVRTVGDASVFLVSGGVKYPIARADLMSALSPLGSVAFVSQAYLDARRTGPAMGRVVRAPDGTISFVDAGIRLPLASCAQVEDFGSSCAAAVPLEARQIARLHPGPRMTNVYATTSGKTFLVTGGTRREVSDTTALAQAGLPTSGVTLLESGIGYLPLGTPVTRDGQVLRSRTTATTILSTGGQHVPLTTGMDRTPGIATLPTATLDEASLRTLTLTAPLNPIVKDTTSSRVYLLTTRGKVHLTTAATIPPTVATATPATLGRIPDAGTAATPVFFKSEDNGTVYYLHAGQRRPLRAWADLITLNGGSPTPTIHTLPGASPALLAPGPFQVAPGSLIMSPDNGTVYLADGPTGRITVGSFAVTAELGATRLASIPATDLAGYTLRPGMLTTAVACGTERYLGLSGRLHPVTPTMATTYRLTFTTLDPSTCAALPRTTQPLDRFLRTPDGTIHHITNGTKHPITSYTRYTQLGGTPTNTLTVTTFTANRFPTGPAA